MRSPPSNPRASLVAEIVRALDVVHEIRDRIGVDPWPAFVSAAATYEAHTRAAHEAAGGGLLGENIAGPGGAARLAPVWWGLWTRADYVQLDRAEPRELTEEERRTGRVVIDRDAKVLVILGRRFETAEAFLPLLMVRAAFLGGEVFEVPFL